MATFLFGMVKIHEMFNGIFSEMTGKGMSVPVSTSKLSFSKIVIFETLRSIPAGLETSQAMVFNCGVFSVWITNFVWFSIISRWSNNDGSVEFDEFFMASVAVPFLNTFNPHSSARS